MGQLVNCCHTVISYLVLSVSTCPLNTTCSEKKKKLILNKTINSAARHYLIKIHLEKPRCVKCLHTKRKISNEIEIYFRGTKLKITS